MPSAVSSRVVGERPLVSSLELAARGSGERIAFDGNGVTLTCAALIAAADALAQGLLAAGVDENEPVLVPCSNHPLGCWATRA